MLSKDDSYIMDYTLTNGLGTEFWELDDSFELGQSAMSGPVIPRLGDILVTSENGNTAVTLRELKTYGLTIDTTVPILEKCFVGQDGRMYRWRWYKLIQHSLIAT